MATLNTYNPPSNKIRHVTGVDFNARPSIFKPVHIVQYDMSIPILEVEMYSNGDVYAAPSGASANIRFRKKGGTVVYNPALGCNTDRTILYFEVTRQMVADWGDFRPIVELKIGEDVAGSSAINVIVDKNPIQDGDIESSDEYKSLTDYVNQAKSYSDAASASQSAAKTSENNAKTSATQAANSASAAATSASSASSSKDAAAKSATAAATSESNAKKSADAAAASQTAAKTSETNAAASQTAAKTSETNAAASEKNAKDSENSARAAVTAASSAADLAATYMTGAETAEHNAQDWSKWAQSYAVGEGGMRAGEASDNAKYYYDQSKRITQALQGALLPMGTVTFSGLKNSTKQAGYMYNVNEAFTSDTDFEDGGGHRYPAGSNVYWTAGEKWDVLAGTQVTTVNGEVGDVKVKLLYLSDTKTTTNLSVKEDDKYAWEEVKWSADSNSNNYQLGIRKSDGKPYLCVHNPDAASQEFYTNKFPQPTVDKLTTARQITLTGDVEGRAVFDGSTDITITTHRYSCAVGFNAPVTAGKQWFKFAELNPASISGYKDFDIIFFVSNLMGATTSTSFKGILTVHVRFGKNYGVEAMLIRWLISTGGVKPQNFCIAAANGTPCTAFELWAKVDASYEVYRFSVISESNRNNSQERNNWWLRDNFLIEGQESPPTNNTTILYSDYYDVSLGSLDIATTKTLSKSSGVLYADHLRLTIVPGRAYSAIEFNSGTRIGYPIKFYPYLYEGSGLVIGDGGMVVIGSGESAGSIFNEETTSGGQAIGHETLYLTSDNETNIIVNCQDLSNKKTYVFNDGSLTIPQNLILKKDSGTSNSIVYNPGAMSRPAITFYPYSDSGFGMVIGTGGRTIIGGGISADTFRNGTSSSNDEERALYLTSDKDVHVVTNLDLGVAEGKEFVFRASGTFSAPSYAGVASDMKITYIQNDTSTSTAKEWTDIGMMSASNVSFSTLFWNISTMFKNIRYLYNSLTQVKSAVSTLLKCDAIRVNTQELTPNTAYSLNCETIFNDVAKGNAVHLVIPISIDPVSSTDTQLLINTINPSTGRVSCRAKGSVTQKYAVTFAVFWYSSIVII